MENANVTILVDAKVEYTKKIIQTIKPFLLDGIGSIFKEAKRICHLRNEPKLLFVTFQELLSQVSSWNQKVIEEETNSIIEASGCDYLNELITAVFVCHTKILSYVRLHDKTKKINLKVPSKEAFIHQIYIELAREFWKQPSLMYDEGLSNIDYQRNVMIAVNIVEACIENTIRRLLPFRTILQQYLSEEDELAATTNPDDAAEDDAVETLAEKKRFSKSEKKKNGNGGSSSKASHKDKASKDNDDDSVSSTSSSSSSSSSSTSSSSSSEVGSTGSSKYDRQRKLSENLDDSSSKKNSLSKKGKDRNNSKESERDSKSNVFEIDTSADVAFGASSGADDKVDAEPVSSNDDYFSLQTEDVKKSNSMFGGSSLDSMITSATSVSAPEGSKALFSASSSADLTFASVPSSSATSIIGGGGGTNATGLFTAEEKSNFGGSSSPKELDLSNLDTVQVDFGCGGGGSNDPFAQASNEEIRNSVMSEVAKFRSGGLSENSSPPAAETKSFSFF